MPIDKMPVISEDGVFSQTACELSEPLLNPVSDSSRPYPRTVNSLSPKMRAPAENVRLTGHQLTTADEAVAWIYAKFNQKPSFQTFLGNIDKEKFSECLRHYLGANALGEVHFQSPTRWNNNQYVLKISSPSRGNENSFIFKCSSTESGLCEYISEMKGVYLVDGKKTSEFATVEGKWAYIPEAHSVELVDGKVTLPDGKTLEGKWAYSPEMKEMYLADGKITNPDGRIEEGKWAYSPEKKDVCRIDAMQQR